MDSFFNFLKGFTENLDYGKMLGYGARKIDCYHGILPTMSILADEKEEDIKSLVVCWKKDVEWRRDYCSKQEANSSTVKYALMPGWYHRCYMQLTPLLIPFNYQFSSHHYYYNNE